MQQSKIFKCLLEVDITPMIKYYTYDEIASIFNIKRSQVSSLIRIHEDNNRINNTTYTNEGYVGAWMNSDERRAVLSYSNESSDIITPNNIESTLKRIKI